MRLLRANSLLLDGSRSLILRFFLEFIEGFMLDVLSHLIMYALIRFNVVDVESWLLPL